VAFASDRFDEVDLLTRKGLFARLPIAEQLIWTALAVRATDPERCRALLERARAGGRTRAALLLAAEALEAGHTAEVRELLHDLSGVKVELLLAWAEAQDGTMVSAASRLESLSERGLPQADYALGLLDLGAAAANWATGQSDSARINALYAMRAFERASTAGFGVADVVRLAQAAHALSKPAGSSPLPWQKLAGQPWTARLLALAQLVGAPETMDPALVRAFSDWEYPTDTPVLAAALLRAGVLARDQGASEASAEFLADLARRAESPANLRAAQRAAANAALLSRDEFPDAVDDPLLALIGCGAALADGDRGKAVGRLRALAVGDADQPDGQPVGAVVVAAFADALEGGSADPLPEAVPAAIAGALDVGHAAARAAGRNPQAAVDSLLRVLLNADVRALVNLGAALPFLGAHATKRGQQAEVAELVRRAADSEADAAGLSAAELARCAALVGDLDTAEPLWGRALNSFVGDDEKYARLSDEYNSFLCHRAVVADLAGDRKAALDYLRRAETDSPGTVGTVLEDLKSDEQISALLGHLFPGSPMLEWQRAGRYPELADAIEESAGLREALESGTSDDVIDEWVEYTADFGDELELWHTVAMLCREDALARAAGDVGATAALTAATALFALPAEEEFYGLSEVTGELLTDHKVRLTRALAGNDIETARAHAKCLAAVARGVPGLQSLLDGGAFEGFPEHYEDDEVIAASRQALDLIEQWGAERVAAAEILLSDKAALAELPPGIDRDYGSAVRELEIMLTLGSVPKGVLVTAVEWHNKWLRCIYQMGEAGPMKAVVRSSSRFADLLAQVCTPNRPHLKENQELGEYYIYMGFHLLPSSPERAIGYFETARNWDPNNVSAAGLIKSAKQRIKNQTLDKGKTYLDRGDYDTAERLLAGSVEGRDLLIGVFVTKALTMSTAGLRLLTAQESRQQGLATARQRADFLVTHAEAVRLLTRAQRIDPRHDLVLEYLEDVRGLPARMGIIR
jgi:tetratricopeptide (TPR) repeat protein